MNNFKCPNCGLTNFATAPSCKKCKVTFQLTDSLSDYQFKLGNSSINQLQSFCDDCNEELLEQTNFCLNCEIKNQPEQPNFNYQVSSFNDYERHSTTKTNFWKIAAFTFAALLFLGFAAYVYMTPYSTLQAIKTAIAEKDARTVSSYIDFPKFKENLKLELNAKMMAEMTKENDKADSFGNLAVGIAGTFVNNLVDTFVSPAGIELLLKDKTENQTNFAAPVNAAQFNNKFLNEDELNVTSGYQSFNEFAIEVNDKTDPTKGVKLIFERRGWWGWQLTNLKIK